MADFVEHESGCGLIDQSALRAAYERGGFYALQLEINDSCDQGCAYCYMNALPRSVQLLAEAEIRGVLRDAAEAGFSVVEWLGGEPLKREGWPALLGRARELGLRNNMWTGGLPLAEPGIAERLAELCDAGLVSVHLSTLDEAIYERLHPGRSAADIATILSGIELLLGAGYPAERILNSVTFTGLQPAEDLIATVDAFESRYGIRTSLNIYHTYLRPGYDTSSLEKFIPDPKDVLRVHKRCEGQWGGPLPMNCVDKRYCSTTVAVLNDGSVTHCATIREGVGNVRNPGGFAHVLCEHWAELTFESMKTADGLPASCASCAMSEYCWGCRSRAYAAGFGLTGPDPRCYRARRSRV